MTKTTFVLPGDELWVSNGLKIHGRPKSVAHHGCPFRKHKTPILSLCLQAKCYHIDNFHHGQLIFSDHLIILLQKPSRWQEGFPTGHNFGNRRLKEKEYDRGTIDWGEI
jgi:hypothetical protein